MFEHPDFKGQYAVLGLATLLIKIGLYNICEGDIFIIAIFCVSGIILACISVYIILKRMIMRIKNKEEKEYIIIMQSILSSLIFIILITICLEIYHRYSIFMSNLFFPGIKHDQS